MTPASVRTARAGTNLKSGEVTVIDLAHVEFTRGGRHALASLREADGAVIVHDARTLEEVERLTMRKPVGKYDVWNEITQEEGMSH